VDINWVLRSVDTLITVTGTNFYNSGVKDIKMSSSDGNRIHTDNDWTYVSSTELTFEFPADFFFNQDFVKVQLYFDGDTYKTIDQRFIVYTEVELLDVKPSYIYTSSGTETYDIFVYGENFWDTENLGLLSCKFDSLSVVQATYINQTLIACEVPASSTART